MTDAAAPPGAPTGLDPASIVRSRAYLSALLLAALLGIPISAIAYGFLALVGVLQTYLFDDLPSDLFEGGTPAWWPVPWLMLSGLLVSLTIRHLPGTAGHSPALGFKAAGGPASQPRPPRHRARRARHAQPRRGARPGGAAHRDRRWAGGPRRCAWPRRTPRRWPSRSWRRPAASPP